MGLKKLIFEEAAKIDEVMRLDLDELAAELDPLLIEILNYGLFSGGKRIRPFLTTSAGRLCGCTDEGIYRLATSFEYLHAATLIHDDIIDNASERRGAASVVSQYGLAEAILAGDFLHAHSMKLVSSFGGPQALSAFCRATMAIVDGEFRQLRNTAGFEQSETEYFTVVKGKTALLIGAACEIGGMYGGGDDGICSALQIFGINLGCAFQIIDDLLDYQGNSDKTGKATGNDLAEGKMTLPVIIALQRADEQDRQALLSIFAAPEARTRSLADVFELVERYQGFSSAREKAEELIDKALAALPVMESQDALKERVILKDLCTYVLNRDK
ncbi:MAG: polyprenyl synthetase family protein [Desulfofustis sp.]|nr:polyprenyl synthetase family protein [Desulfofustis sp.]